jgi:hypothetical protein
MAIFMTFATGDFLVILIQGEPAHPIMLKAQVVPLPTLHGTGSNRMSEVKHTRIDASPTHPYALNLHFYQCSQPSLRSDGLFAPM